MTTFKIDVRLDILETQRGWIWQATCEDNRYLGERVIVMCSDRAYKTEDDARHNGAFAITGNPT